MAASIGGNTDATPALPTGQLWTMAKNDLSWLQKHERIVIVALVLLVGGFLGNKALNYDASLKDAKVAALTQVVAQDKQNVAAIALQAATAQQQYQVTLDAITKQNVALEASVAQESTILAQRQVADKALPLPALAQRLEVLVPAAQGGVTATTSGMSLSSAASYGVVNVLEQVPVLTNQLASETQVAQNNADLVNKSQAVSADLALEVGGLNKSLTDQTAQCKAEVAAEKVKTKKAWRNGFKWGAITGFIGGIFVGQKI